LANDIAAKAEEYGLVPEVIDMEAIEFDHLHGKKRILIACSTWGEGEQPDNA